MSRSRFSFLMSLGGVLLICLIVFWLVSRRNRNTTPPKPEESRKQTELLEELLPDSDDSLKYRTSRAPREPSVKKPK